MKASFITSAMAGLGLAAALAVPAAAQRGPALPDEDNAADACVMDIIDEDKAELAAAGGGVLDYDKLDLLGMIAECEAKTGVKANLTAGGDGPHGIKVLVNAAAAPEPALDADGCVSAEIAKQIHDIAVKGGGVLDLDEAALDTLVEKCETETKTQSRGFFGMTRFKLTIPAM